MAYLKKDLSGQVLHFYEMSALIVMSPIGNPVRIQISTDDNGLILDETYWPDFNSEVTVDIKDIVANELSLEIPVEEEDMQQASVFKVFHYSIADGEESGSFTVNGFSEEAYDKVSDIDILRIPKDYRLPLSLCNFCQRSGIKFIFPDKSSIDLDGLETNASGVGITSRMINLADITEIDDKGRFAIELECDGTYVSAPVFEVANGHFEQYLFANRYGGFDNIAMDGTLDFVPEMSFESGSYNGFNEQTSSDSEYIYSQNSGYLSRKVLELMSELLCSSQIYHLQNGEFRRIVILDSNLSSKSTEHLHAFSFRFKYADDSRPLSLKGKTRETYSVREDAGSTTLMYKLTGSPMIIQHNRNNFPCVTVIDDKNQVVTVAIEYIDQNSIELSWNGNLNGYAYIR